MAMASTIAAVFLSLALMDGAITNGRVSSVEADSVQIAVNPGEEPALGSKIEVILELKDGVRGIVSKSG